MFLGVFSDVERLVVRDCNVVSELPRARFQSHTPTLNQILVQQHTPFAGRWFNHAIAQGAFQVKLVGDSLVVIDVLHDQYIHPLIAAARLTFERNAEDTKYFGQYSWQLLYAELSQALTEVILRSHTSSKYALERY